jgi:DnaJ homologue, subfamily C, member 28, conserved domain
MEGYESPVERLIREAQERGEFDNLPGAGKPLTNLGGTDDPDWWVRGLIKREELDMTGALPPALALRKEAAGFPTSLVELRTEEAVREVLDDYNRRVRLDRLRPAEGKLPPLLAKTVDTDELVVQWRALRAARSARAPAGRLDAEPPESPETPETPEAVELPERVEQLPLEPRGRRTLWPRLLRRR